MRFFNTGGPCRPDMHYMLPATERLQSYDVMRLIRQHAYFVVHAPRQTGKTTAMLELADQLTASGAYAAVLLSCEVGAPFSEDVVRAERAIVSSWRDIIRYTVPEALQPVGEIAADSEGTIIGNFLRSWAASLPIPLIIFLDEIDALQDEALISVLRQLRSGYNWRPQAFPASLALVGLRDVRDYKIKSGGSDRLTSPSPFNIAVRSITLRNFTQAEVRQLLLQHTTETGQPFEEQALAHVFYLTQGQPWLVNALAKLCVEELVPDSAQAVTADNVDTAKEMLIMRRQTHLDSLADKLNEERVRRVIEPLLAGEALDQVIVDDIDYATDLGLIRSNNGSSIEIANPIYKEIIPRALASTAQASLPRLSPTWLNSDGSLNTNKLLDAFLAFWRQHGQPLLKTAPYHEVAPHLVMMAFLHRVVNANGSLEREYAIGSGRMDLLVRHGKPPTLLPIELKTWRDGRRDPLAEGLVQFDRYLDGLGLESGWLVIFDQRSGQPPIETRTAAETVATPAGRMVTLIRA